MRGALLTGMMVGLGIGVSGCGANESPPEAIEPGPEPAAAEPPAEPPTKAAAEPPAPPPTEAAAEPTEAELVATLGGARSTSIGGPNDGRVEGAVALPLRGPGFRFNPRRSARARYGTVEMVQALVAAAARVEAEMPGGELVVNDLGYEEGGPIPHHGSHRAGRDVDTLFYLVDAEGTPLPSVGAPIDPRGEGTDYRDLSDPADDVPLRVDLGRTWLFVQALLELDGDSPVQRIFVVEHLRSRLLEHARAADAPEAIVERFADLTCQPSYPHDDHFHIRFFCSPEDIGHGCEDAAPLYPWRRRALGAEGVDPIRHRPRPDRPMAPVTTEAEAQAAAGELHPSVRAFLERRKAWSAPPHPGRPWCR